MPLYYRKCHPFAVHGPPANTARAAFPSRCRTLPQIESIRDIIPILEQVTRLNQPLLIIAEDVTGGWLCCVVILYCCS